jgi:hypothetical protein
VPFILKALLILAKSRRARKLVLAATFAAAELAQSPKAQAVRKGADTVAQMAIPGQTG